MTFTDNWMSAEWMS